MKRLNRKLVHLAQIACGNNQVRERYPAKRLQLKRKNLHRRGPSPPHNIPTHPASHQLILSAALTAHESNSKGLHRFLSHPHRCTMSRTRRIWINSQVSLVSKTICNLFHNTPKYSLKKILSSTQHPHPLGRPPRNYVSSSYPTWVELEGIAWISSDTLIDVQWVELEGSE